VSGPGPGGGAAAEEGDEVAVLHLEQQAHLLEPRPSRLCSETTAVAASSTSRSMKRLHSSPRHDATPKSSVRPATACVLPKGRRSGGYPAPNSPDKAASAFPERIAGGVSSVVSVVLSGGGG
jgi:hypothetical protein